MSEETTSLTDEVTAVLEELVEEAPVLMPTPTKGETALRLSENEFLLGERHYRVVQNYREGFQLEAFAERFSDVLSRYDYIVGDWGYEQLRLKGFFATSNKRVLPDQRIDTLTDYLYEFCNFGCAYFVVQRLDVRPPKKRTRRSKNHKSSKKQTVAHVEQKTEKVMKPKVKPKIKNRQPMQVDSTALRPKSSRQKQNTGENKKGFTIRKREE